MKLFVPNPDFEEMITETAEWKAMRLSKAEATLDQVKMLAPVHTGYFRDSLYVDNDGNLCSSDFFAEGIEFGSINNPPYAPFRRGVRAAGLRLKEHP